jgi:hypothetical protein
MQRRTLVGTGGLLGPTAAGFLFAQSGDVVSSVVAFDATTRTSAQVGALTGLTPDLPNVVFSVEANSLTRLAFVNGSTPKATVVIGAGGNVATATGAVVSFNAATGLVVAVLPYTSNRSTDGPTVHREDGVSVLRGPFLGVWDGEGRNLAPNGASEVRIAEGTGVVVSVQ